MQKNNKVRRQHRKIRAQVYMHAVYLEAGFFDKTPENFARYFEAQRVDAYYERFIVSPKWERNINGDTLPRECTVKLISKKCPHSEKYYSSLLWIALEPGTKNQKFWLKFFQQLPLSFKRLLRQGLKNTLRNERLKFVNFRKLRRIFSYLNENALACLIALLKIEQSYEDESSMWYQLIEQHVYALLLHLLSTQPYAPYRYELFSYFRDHVVTVETNKLCNKKLWSKTSEQLDLDLTLFNDAIELAVDKHLIKNKKDKSEFIFFLPLSQILVICFELANDDFSEMTKRLKIKSIHWLLNEINQLRPNEQKILI